MTHQKKGYVQQECRTRAWQQREALANVKLSRLSSRHFKEFKTQRSKGAGASKTIRLDGAPPVDPTGVRMRF